MLCKYNTTTNLLYFSFEVNTTHFLFNTTIQNTKKKFNIFFPLIFATTRFYPYLWKEFQR